jgi:hypothetical protein
MVISWVEKKGLGDGWIVPGGRVFEVSARYRFFSVCFVCRLESKVRPASQRCLKKIGCPLRWLNFKISIHKEKSPDQLRCIVKTETIEA